MIQGTVSRDLTPTIKINLVGVNHREEEVVALIDTGFDGALMLPLGALQSLGWPSLDRIEVELADASKPKMSVFRGIVMWKGNPRIIVVLASEVMPLVGLELLEGNELRIQVKRGGTITINVLTPDRIQKMNGSKKVIGLVGGMGSGKSRVAEAFLKHGGALVSGDAFGHEALERPEILARIAQRWGERVVDESGAVDRKKLGTVVFASAVERANLEHLVFPWIEQRIRDEIAKAQADPKTPFVVLDAAIMLEAGWNYVCDRIVYVHAPRTVRLERLIQHRGWNADEVAQRETAQLPLTVKATRADAAVDNSGHIAHTRNQVDALVRQWILK